MKRILTDKKGETHINTAIIIVIAVVVGALILGGLYMLFAGNNGVFDRLNDKIYDMSNTGGERSLKLENGQMMYSYDSETWVDFTVTGLEENGQVKKYITLTNNETVIHHVLIGNPSNSVVCRSVDGKEWTPVRTSSDTSLSLVRGNSGKTAALYYNNGMTYTTSDGLNWTMTSTKNY